jgi:uncharacterized protein (TIGR02118 family)
MKHIVFLRAPDGPVSLQREALEIFAAPPFDVTVNLVQGGEIDASWHVVIEAWTDERTLIGCLQRLSPHVARAVYRVTESVEKDQGPAPGWPVSGVRLIVPWTGRGDVSAAEQRRHWDEHVPLANRVHVGVTRYVRNWVECAVGDDAESAPAYRGIASQHYASERDLRERSFDSPASVQVILADVADFIAEPTVLQVVEYRRAECTDRRPTP